MRENKYTLTYSDGESETITNEDVAVLEDNVQYVSYKRTLSKNYNTVSMEVSSSISHLGLKKTMAFVRQKAEYEVQSAFNKMEF